MSLRHTFLETPVGRLRLVASDDALVAIHFPETSLERDAAPAAHAPHAVLARASEELTEYFAGTRTRFDVPLDPRGTEFQIVVWQALRDIAIGDTSTYASLAARIGRPTASRAVGAANGRNPLSVIVPCHRVIGADGSLTGYAGGLPRKRWLLDHEARLIGRTAPPPPAGVSRAARSEGAETRPELSCI